MSISSEQLQPVAVGSRGNRVEALRLLLGYPLKQKDSQGSKFWFLRPGVDENEAEDTCPIAVGFYSELNHLSKDEILQFLTADEQQNEIYGHYTQRTIPNRPVMYLLLPENDSAGQTSNERSGRVVIVLPSEGKLRQRQIQSFAWTEQDLQARLNRLRQSELARTERMQEKALSVIPLVEWAFYKPIETAKELAEKLAEVSRKIEQAIPAVYEAEEQDGYLHTLLTSFQRELLSNLKLKADNEKDYSFADIYAQTIAYGLFTARVFGYTMDEQKRQDEQNPERKERDFNRQNAWEYLPETNPFLRRLFKDVSQQPIAKLGEDLVDAIAEVFSILRAAKMDAILADFRAKMNREDIVIRFYEDFLTAYKPKMRERRGVYYTPEPVVSYMVRSVDILLKEKFNKPLGLADPEVMILDPACGTGTFLLWIFQLIYQRFQENPEAMTEGLEDRSWSRYVQDRLLPRIFGFELLMAPYAISHLKLGLFLQETGYQFNTGKRLKVYLTNTLDDAIEKTESLFEEFIAEEANQAARVKKNEPIMIVIGNPPYSISSSNKGTWILGLLQKYKEGLNEKKLNLDDDYIKFIRFAQNRIDTTKYGILAFITNHSFLSGLVHRQMRKSLLESFSSIQLFDLHGSSLMKEKSPDGGKDENVFDIQQGVSLFIGEKLPQKEFELGEAIFSEVYGDRSKKYKYLIENDIRSTRWKKLNPESSKFFFFCEKDFNLRSEYENGYLVTKIFPLNSSGFQTKRDSITIQYSEDELNTALHDLLTLTDDNIRAKYSLPADGRDWQVSWARNALSRVNNYGASIIDVLYRPFDLRKTCYLNTSKGFIAYPRFEVFKHLLQENLCLVTVRQLSTDSFQHSFTTNCPGDGNAISINTREYNYYFPLFIYAEPDKAQRSVLSQHKSPNLDQAFVDELTKKLGYSPSVELIFYYIYAVLYSPAYRTRYIEFLKIDFPRVPLTSNNELFRQLSFYGKELVALHLMKSPKLDVPITQFVKAGGNLCVDPGHPKYDGSSSSVAINKKGDKFTGVPKAVWNFYIGGYQVCQKWLKDRKGRTLTQEDITHYQRIVVALQETMCLMQQIDEAIPRFPIE
jgi:type I restriction-modification system DNA methylase subunit